MLNNKKVKVCGYCLTACCYQGIFLCNGRRNAKIAERTIDELKILDLESSFYWENEDSNYESMFGKKCNIDFNGNEIN